MKTMRGRLKRLQANAGAVDAVDDAPTAWLLHSLPMLQTMCADDNNNVLQATRYYIHTNDANNRALKLRAAFAHTEYVLKSTVKANMQTHVHCMHYFGERAGDGTIDIANNWHLGLSCLSERCALHDREAWMARASAN